MKVQDLFEAIIKKEKIEDLKVKKAIAFLNAHCKNGLKAISNNGLLFRGISDKAKYNKEGFTLVDTEKLFRTSRDSNNAYQLLMDNSSAFAKFPKRSNSLICSSSYSTAEGYDRLYVMIPIDGTFIAESSSDDFLNSDFDIDEVDRAASVILYNATGVNASSLKFPEALKNVSLEQLLLKFGGVKSIKKLKSDLHEAGFYAGETETDKISPKLISAMISFFNDNNGDDSIEAQIFTQLLKAKPEDRLAQIGKAVFSSPAKVGLSLKPFGSTLKPNVECWFSGKAVAIARPMFKSILKELLKRGDHVSAQYLDDFDFGYDDKLLDQYVDDAD